MACYLKVKPKFVTLERLITPKSLGMYRLPRSLYRHTMIHLWYWFFGVVVVVFSRGMNAFLLGARILSPNVTVRSVTINSWGSEFFEYQAAQQLHTTGCKMLAHHSNTMTPLQYFIDHDLLVVGSNSDTRVFLGEKVITAPLFAWQSVFVDTIQVAGAPALFGNALTVVM